MKTNEERLEKLIKNLDILDHIDVAEIPKIDLYMDQVTTFMEKHLADTKRYDDDKILTKTMINNYAKNNLLPSPVKKKYTQEHIILLVFIYYFKNLLNFNDIETILSYIRENHFGEEQLPLADIYTEVFALSHQQKINLKNDVKEKFDAAGRAFTEVEDEAAKNDLQLFAFICELAFDVYLKKRMIEQMIDDLRAEQNPPKK